MQVDGLPVINYLMRRMGQVLSGTPVPPIVAFMSPELPKNVHVITLERQIVHPPTGDR